MRIGLLGLAFDSGNKGCEALGYGFLQILQDIAYSNDQVFDIDIFEVCNIERIYHTVDYKNLNLKSVFVPGIGSLKHLKDHKNAYQKCEIIYDFTAGDSFSDIYGMERFLRRTIIKILALKSTKKFILGSQTYGPYKRMLSKKMASYVLKKSYKVYARDVLSCEIVKRLSGVSPIQTIDVAFAMPYQTQKKHLKKTAGFNPSGLLWGGGYTGNNQFGLTVDYKEYCSQVIQYLFSLDYRIVLISHVLSHDLTQKDNDVVACNELHMLFPQTVLAPYFETPVEAKTYISGLDLFIGARMHATIAALSTMVPVLPFSYSRKFEGLFSSLGYNHVVSGTKVSTKEAVEETKEFINNVDTIQLSLKEYEDRIMAERHYIVSEIENDLYEGRNR